MPPAETAPKPPMAPLTPSEITLLTAVWASLRPRATLMPLPRAETPTATRAESPAPFMLVPTILLSAGVAAGKLLLSGLSAAASSLKWEATWLLSL